MENADRRPRQSPKCGGGVPAAEGPGRHGLASLAICGDSFGVSEGLTWTTQYDFLKACAVMVFHLRAGAAAAIM